MKDHLRQVRLSPCECELLTEAMRYYIADTLDNEGVAHMTELYPDTATLRLTRCSGVYDSEQLIMTVLK